MPEPRYGPDGLTMEEIWEAEGLDLSSLGTLAEQQEALGLPPLPRVKLPITEH